MPTTKPSLALRALPDEGDASVAAYVGAVRSGIHDGRGSGNGYNCNPSNVGDTSDISMHATTAYAFPCDSEPSPYGHECPWRSCGCWATQVAKPVERAARGSTSAAGVNSMRKCDEERLWAAFGWALPTSPRSSCLDPPLLPLAP